jgi:hypothetical protein
VSLSLLTSEASASHKINAHQGSKCWPVKECAKRVTRGGVVEVEESGKVGNPPDEERSDKGSRGRGWCAGLDSKQSAGCGSTSCCRGDGLSDEKELSEAQSMQLGERVSQSLPGGRPGVPENHVQMELSDLGLLLCLDISSVPQRAGCLLLICSLRLHHNARLYY